ncbi:unnamed protein product, partial [Iphiclides podalirius]
MPCRCAHASIVMPGRIGTEGGRKARKAHFGEYLLRQQMLHAASLSGLQHRVGADAEPPACDARLLNAELWRRFHDIGTEMIITKGGRHRVAMSANGKKSVPSPESAAAAASAVGFLPARAQQLVRTVRGVAVTSRSPGRTTAAPPR